METLEARLALAALQLWVDPKQPLAAAEIGRLLTHPADGDQWLNQVLEKPGEAYLTQPEVSSASPTRPCGCRFGAACGV